MANASIMVRDDSEVAKQRVSLNVTQRNKKTIE